MKKQMNSLKKRGGGGWAVSRKGGLEMPLPGTGKKNFFTFFITGLFFVVVGLLLEEVKSMKICTVVYLRFFIFTSYCFKVLLTLYTTFWKQATLECATSCQVLQLIGHSHLLSRSNLMFVPQMTWAHWSCMVLLPVYQSTSIQSFCDMVCQYGYSFKKKRGGGGSK